MTFEKLCKALGLPEDKTRNITIVAEAGQRAEIMVRMYAGDTLSEDEILDVLRWQNLIVLPDERHEKEVI